MLSSDEPHVAHPQNGITSIICVLKKKSQVVISSGSDMSWDEGTDPDTEEESLSRPDDRLRFWEGSPGHRKSLRWSSVSQLMFELEVHILSWPMSSCILNLPLGGGERRIGETSHVHVGLLL